MTAKRWNLWLKLALFVALAGAMAFQVFHRRDWSALAEAMPNPWRDGAAWGWLIVLVLVPVNWGLEADKWRRLIQPVQQIRLMKAFAAVLSGVTLGLFTPNRVGEYGGRVLYLEPPNRWPAVALSLVGSYAQLYVTLVVGLGCGWHFWQRHADNLAWTLPGQPELWLLGGAVAAVLVLVAYGTLPQWAGRSLAKRLPDRIGRHMALLQQLPRRTLLAALVLSLARYAVFTAQYLVLLRVFGVSIGLAKGVTAIGTVFLVQSVLPTLAAVELLKRGNVALLVFGVFTTLELSVLATSTALWLVNLLVPALVGYALLLRRDFFRRASDTPHANHPAVPVAANDRPPGTGE